MVLSFWLPIAFMLVLALAFVLVPFIRYQKEESKLDVSSAWYRNRESELKQELAAGLFSEKEYQQAVTELKLTAKDELTVASEVQDAQTDSERYNAKLVYVAAALMAISVIGFYGFNGLYNKQAEKREILAQMPALSQKVIQGSDQQVSPKELVHFALGLRTKLSEKEDYIGWMLLGRVYTSLNDVESGIDAFRKSYKMNRQNVSNTVSFAQALLYRGETWDIQEALTMLQEAMMFQPDNVQSVILFGEGSMLLEQNDNAKRSFEIALSMLPTDDQRYELVSQRLRFLEAQINGEPTTTKVKATGVQGITVQIELSPSVTIDLSEYSHVFLFAKSSAMPMPIAVRKVPLSDLPMTLTLTDENIMLPEQKLSQFKVVDLFARLSKDESAEFSAGEWQGTKGNVSTMSKETIVVIIDEGK